jgi:alkylation response protein AidB-like acyl-CoA dehydrogenase
MTSNPSDSDTSETDQSRSDESPADQSRSDESPADQSRSDTLEQAEFRARVLAWHHEHATPRSAADLWTTPPYLDDSAAHESFEAARAWQRTLFDHGWAGLSWPAEFGGADGEPR